MVSMILEQKLAASEQGQSCSALGLLGFGYCSLYIDLSAFN